MAEANLTNVVPFRKAPAADVSPAPVATAGLHAAEAKPAAPAPVVFNPLKEGMKGALVRALQTNLTVWGFNPGAVDGVFGPKTADAVRAVQRKLGVEPITGAFDAATAAVVKADLANPQSKLKASASLLVIPKPATVDPTGVTPDLSTGTQVQVQADVPFYRKPGFWLLAGGAVLALIATTSKGGLSGVDDIRRQLDTRDDDDLPTGVEPDSFFDDDDAGDDSNDEIADDADYNAPARKLKARATKARRTKKKVPAADQVIVAKARATIGEPPQRDPKTGRFLKSGRVIVSE